MWNSFIVMTGLGTSGSTENGMKSAREYIYILDADFVPEPDVLHKMIHFFDERVGMVQTQSRHQQIIFNINLEFRPFFLMVITP